ncbi:hypothetical protein E6C67_08180 [Azospirillum sp. TSA2s]|uniref:hypothetical protein n=1 Tax=Azospirillum sp. TSA2s TaxID=709810 RepID=UPI0010A9E83D|nr:hypothetical protein [Azospirillum sp. TSA2s]QCG93918.1 hypothetical protein E6C67_08180 [Azospirillum sp. TSA2s]
MSKHTPGPYVVKKLHAVGDMDMEGFPPETLGVYAKSDLSNKDECPSALCFMNTNWGEHKQTAKLFAAADVMLAALNAVHDEMVTAGMAGTATHRLVVDAIAKAEG